MTAVLDLAHSVLDDTRTWGSRAACISLANVLEDPQLVDEAKALCAACPVRVDCLTWVLPLRGKNDPGGVRAGLTEPEREEARAKMPRPSKPAPKPTSPDGKWCGRCKQIKPVGEYHRNNQHKDGLATYCRPCAARIQATRRARKPAA